MPPKETTPKETTPKETTPKETTPKEMSYKDLLDLTERIDSYNYENEDTITPLSLHARWWPLLNQLRQAPNKTALLEGWKYKKELENTEYSYAANSNKHINVDDWEQRFVLDLWLSIYH
jgi:hypothetical protein